MLQLKILHAGIKTLGLPGGISGKEPTCQCRRCKRQGFDPWVRKIPWKRAQQPALVLLPRESHGQRSLAGCSPQGRTESDTTEATKQQHQHLYMESRKMVLKNLFTGQQWRKRHREQAYGHGEGAERVRGMERVRWKVKLPYVKQIANGNLLYDSGNSNRGSVSTQGGGRWEGGSKGRGYMYTYG